METKSNYVAAINGSGINGFEKMHFFTYKHLLPMFEKNLVSQPLELFVMT